MFPVIGKCPVCGETMTVTRLHCRTCDSALEGQFSLGRFYRLSPQQLAFIETFIRCEGKLTRVQEELNISYPTARARLTEVIRALGYDCLLYTSDAADDLLCVDLGGRRIIKNNTHQRDK
mgnify:CR=1 FL=1